MANDLTKSNPARVVAAALPDYLQNEYEIAAQITRSVMKQADGDPFYVQIQSPIVTSSVPPQLDKDGKPQDPPEVCDILNLETGELQVLIVNTVLGSELRRAFPDDAYVSRMFGVVRGKSANDKRYKGYKIIELKRKSHSEIEKVQEIDGTTKDALDNAKQYKAKSK